MKATLLIEAAPSVLVQILSSLPPGAFAIGIPPTGDSSPSEETDDGPVNTSAPSVDTSGLPWDERIHASTKATNADGTWKKRRGGPTGDALTAIEAELRAAQPAAPVVAQPVAAAPSPLPPPAGTVAAAPIPIPQTGELPPPAAAPVAPPMAPAATVPVALPPVAAELAPAPAPVASTEPPAAEGLDFARFMQHVAGQMQKKAADGVTPLLTAENLAEYAQEISTAWANHGVAPLTNITEISTNPALITYAVQLMQRDGRW